MSTDDQNTKPARAAVIADLRPHVGNLLSAGTPLADVSFALAYVATELGLYVTSKSALVLHVVFQGVVEATQAHEDATNAAAGPETTDDQPTVKRPRGAGLH